MRIVTSKVMAAGLFLLIVFSSGCLSPSKMDKHVSSYYGNQLPKLDKKKIQELSVESSIPPSSKGISTTRRRTTNFLPLIVYWSYDYSHTVTLNPAIPVNAFSNTINKVGKTALEEKLKGRKLELTVERIPKQFALVDEERLYLFISTSKIYVRADTADLVVSYRLLEGQNILKTGKISIENTAENKNIRLFQGWRSSASEHLAEYNQRLIAMSRSFVKQLAGELQIENAKLDDTQ